MRTFLLLGLALLCFNSLIAQVNAYAKVTSVSGTVINLSNVNETYDTFEAGEKLIIMQMQDDVLGTNTADNSSFGTISSIASAGLYEVLTISSVTESGGVPTSITVSTAPGTYNFNTNSSVQVISYPRFGGGSDYTTTSNITSLDWDGNIGGVVCFYVEGDLTIAHTITADGAGFDGGVANTDNSSGSCNSTLYRTGSNNQYAAKGDGIYKNVTTTYELGRGHIANGAGGGNSHNGGGGGGGNFTSGGEGGAGWQCNPSAGGLGGISLQSYISSSRVFLGGGGGSGEGNNGFATAGGKGGGIILIKADAIRTTGTCSSRTISANGDAASDTPFNGNDGAGGGGAGGSIVLVADNYYISATCPLTVAASGGTGGTVNDDVEHGAGGGGGMGTIIYSIPEPADVTTDNTSGTGGANGNGSGASSTSGGSGDPDDGVIDDGDSGGLPVELLQFKATSTADGVSLEWSTATELDNDHFEVLRSEDLVNWWVVAIQPGHGTTSQVHHYYANDPFAPQKVLYYRLKQVDYDGTETLSKIVVVDRLGNTQKFEIFPNPAVNQIQLKFQSAASHVEVLDMHGHLIRNEKVAYNTFDMNINIQGLEKGIYLVRVNYLDGANEQIKLVVM